MRRTDGLDPTGTGYWLVSWILDSGFYLRDSLPVPHVVEMGLLHVNGPPGAGGPRGGGRAPIGAGSLRPRRARRAGAAGLARRAARRPVRGRPRGALPINAGEQA